MKYVRKPFTLPPGPPSRVIIFLPETKGLREYANQLGLRTWGRLVDMAISMAFIAFGQHPDSHQDIRDQLVDAFGHRMYNPNEKIRERIARYNAPRSIRTAAGLVQWYLEERFPAPEWVPLPQDWDDSDDDDDDNNNDNDETEYDGDTDDDGDANDS